MRSSLILLTCLFLSSVTAYAGAALDTRLINSLMLGDLHQALSATYFTRNSDLASAPLTISSSDFGVRQFTNQFDRVSSRLSGESCILPELGCLTVGYLDSAERVEFTSKGKPIAGQLLLKSFLETEAKLNPKQKSNYRDIYKTIRNSPAQNDHSKKLQILVDSWLFKQISIKTLASQIYRTPDFFQSLPKIYNQISTTQISLSDLQKFEVIIQNCYLMTLDAIYQGANSELGSYPYDDDLAKPGSLIDVRKLYTVLNVGKSKWPAFGSLSPLARADFGGRYTDKTKDQSRWIVKATYNDLTNKIWIDYSAPFYENIYVLYHELWHVLWNNSEVSSESLQNILKDLECTDGNSDARLRNDLLTLVKTNEFLAIEQQIRLFHATSAYVGDWANETFNSSKNWHDSYMGADIYHRMITRTDRKSADLVSKTIFKYTNGAFDPDWHPRNLFVGAAMHDHFRAGWDEDYLAKQLILHEKNFGKLYLNEPNAPTLNYSAQEAKVLNQLASGMLKAPKTVALHCEQINKIKRALGVNWDFGIPFAYILSDKNCDEPSDPSHPSTEGSHPSTEGSHPAVQGFPSLEGPESSGGAE